MIRTLAIVFRIARIHNFLQFWNLHQKYLEELGRFSVYWAISSDALDMSKSIRRVPKFTAKWVSFLRFSEPSIRGVLNGIQGISTTTGMFLIYLLGSFFSWRQVSYVCAAVPIANILVAIFVSAKFFQEIPSFSMFTVKTSFSLPRCRKLRFGCFQKTVPTKPKEHCRCCVDGCQPKVFPLNSIN